MAEAPPDAHVFFVHSPITYSIAIAAIRHASIAKPKLMGARGITGDGIARTVEDDGIWSIPRTCALLRQIVELIPADAKAAIYLPHTSFLMGKLVKLSGRIGRIFYLEEGYTSTHLSLLNKYMGPHPVQLDWLVSELEAGGLIDALQIDRDGLARLNEIKENAFDADCLKYAGAFSCSPDAFVGLPSVTRLPLDVAPERRPVRLVSFFGIRNRYGDAIQIETICRSLGDVIDSMQTMHRDEIPLLVKLHPRDGTGLPAWFYGKLQQLGIDYSDYCRANAIDANTEPALLNFEHYFLFGQTAQAKYVEMFLGKDRMTQYDFP
jgi:hypothetical protein